MPWITCVMKWRILFTRNVSQECFRRVWDRTRQPRNSLLLSSSGGEVGQGSVRFLVFPLSQSILTWPVSLMDHFNQKRWDRGGKRLTAEAGTQEEKYDGWLEKLLVFYGMLCKAFQENLEERPTLHINPFMSFFHTSWVTRKLCRAGWFLVRGDITRAASSLPRLLKRKSLAWACMLSSFFRIGMVTTGMTLLLVWVFDRACSRSNCWSGMLLASELLRKKPFVLLIVKPWVVVSCFLTATCILIYPQEVI